MRGEIIYGGGSLHRLCFGKIESCKTVQKGVYAKMAHGDIVRCLTGIQGDGPE